MILVDNKEIIVRGKIIKTARIKDEWFGFVEEPEILIKKIKNSKIGVDIFTFRQRFPENKLKYNYHMNGRILRLYLSALMKIGLKTKLNLVLEKQLEKLRKKK